MNLTEEQLKEVEEMSYRLIPPSFIAINIEVDELDFQEAIKIPNTPVRSAFYKGHIRQMIEIRESLIKAAKNGSNPAQQELIKFLSEQQNIIKHG